MRNYRQPGHVWDYTNSSGSTIAAGTGVIIGTVVGFAVDDIADGETGAVIVRGVIETAKPSAETIGQGVSVNFDATNQEFQLAAGDLANAGTAAMPAASGETIVWVDINQTL